MGNLTEAGFAAQMEIRDMVSDLLSRIADLPENEQAETRDYIISMLKDQI